MTDTGETEPVRCGVCGEVVGVYEPAAFATPHGQSVMASLLTPPQGLGSEFSVNHAACWNGGTSRQS